MSGVGKVVCVTGASGYIASWLVNLLLQHGYTVRATVRNLNDSKKIQHLLSFDGAKERLHLFKADLLEEGSFDSVVNGCEGVFHTASPVLVSVTDPQAELIDPAVKGTLNVLRSCAKAGCVKRVVFTSSSRAVFANGRPVTPDVVADETWVSDTTFCEKSKDWYALAKTLAEKGAWKFAEENGIDLVTINPGFVIGPPLQQPFNITVEIILNLVNGADSTFPNRIYRFVDVRDVALAHIQAFKVASAGGRYCLIGHVVHSSEVMNILQQLFPTLSIPTKCADDKPPVPTHQVSKEKAKSLGIEFIPLKVSLSDTVEIFKERGFVNY